MSSYSYSKMEEKDIRRPFIDPLILLLKSRRVLIGIFTLLIGFIVAMLVPHTIDRELLLFVGAIGIALILSFTFEDAARATKPASDTVEKRGADQMQLIAEAVRDNAGKPRG